MLADFFGVFTLFLAAAFTPYCNLSSFCSSPNRENVEGAWTSFSTVGVILNLPDICIARDVDLQVLVTSVDLMFLQNNSTRSHV